MQRLILFPKHHHSLDIDPVLILLDPSPPHPTTIEIEHNSPSSSTIENIIFVGVIVVSVSHGTGVVLALCRCMVLVCLRFNPYDTTYSLTCHTPAFSGRGLKLTIWSCNSSDGFGESHGGD